MKAIATQYIDGAFVESHGREVMDSINPNNGTVIARVTLGDEEDARRAISAAKGAFAGFARTTKEERSDVLRRLNEVVAARINDLTAAMVEEYGGVIQFSKLIVQMVADSFLHAEKALQELSLIRTLPGASRHGRRRKTTIDARLDPLPRHVCEMDGIWLFAERLLYVDWVEERALS